MAATTDKPKSQSTRRTTGGRYAKGSSGNPRGSTPYNPVLVKARMLEEAKRRGDPAAGDLAILHSPKADWSSGRCIICRSPHRLLVDRWAAEQVSTREIARRLQQLGITISHGSVHRHTARHVDIRSEVLQRYVEQEATVTERIDDETSDIDRLDGYIRRASQLEKQLTQYVRDCTIQGTAPPMSVTHALETVTSGLRQAIKLRQDLTAGTPSDDIDRLLGALWQSEGAGRSESPKAAVGAGPRVEDAAGL